MKTIVLEKPGVLRLTDTEARPEPRPDEALVRVRRVGICGTDFHAFKGEQPFFEYPRVLGHELAVEIAALGKNALGLAVGDRCSVEPYLSCGHCFACRRGNPNCCVNLKVLGVHVDGGMREFAVVPVGKLHKSVTLDLDQLALVEMFAIGAHAVKRAQLETEEVVLVIGAGPIGLSVIQFAQLVGAKVMVMEIKKNRLEFCHRQLQVETCLDGKDDPLPRLKAILGGDLPTAVFDATGNPNSMTKAFNYIAHGGRLIFAGLFQGDVTFSDPDFHRRELTLMSSRNATGDDFTWTIKLLEEGKLDTASMITHRAPFEETVTAFPRWLEPETGVIKAVVQF